MKTRHIILLLLAALVWGGCSTRAPKPVASVADEQQREPGDSTIYALACDGCNDTLLVFMPMIGADPDTLFVLEATASQRVFGHPKIGDRLAIVRDAADSAQAYTVIDLDDLKGTWCYQVTPTLRERADKSEQRALLKNTSDSLLRELMMPRVYKLVLGGDNTAWASGHPHHATASEEEMEPVVWPEVRHYNQWALLNGWLVLRETHVDSLGHTLTDAADTISLLLLRRDTLALRFADHVQGYYREPEQPQE